MITTKARICLLKASPQIEMTKGIKVTGEKREIKQSTTGWYSHEGSLKH